MGDNHTRAEEPDVIRDPENDMAPEDSDFLHRLQKKRETVKSLYPSRKKKAYNPPARKPRNSLLGMNDLLFSYFWCATILVAL